MSALPRAERAVYLGDRGRDKRNALYSSRVGTECTVLFDAALDTDARAEHYEIVVMFLTDNFIGIARRDDLEPVNGRAWWRPRRHLSAMRLGLNVEERRTGSALSSAAARRP